MCNRCKHSHRSKGFSAFMRSHGLFQIISGPSRLIMEKLQISYGLIISPFRLDLLIFVIFLNVCLDIETLSLLL
jgi:hypothetical protein